MSPPERDIERQKRRHRGPLIGSAAVVIFALALLAWWLAHEVSEGQAPRDVGTHMDGRTGEIVTDPGSPDAVDTDAGTSNPAAAPDGAPTR